MLRSRGGGIAARLGSLSGAVSLCLFPLGGLYIIRGVLSGEGL